MSSSRTIERQRSAVNNIAIMGNYGAPHGMQRLSHARMR
jgi:hypothetical protein